jgi:hypothetical protein
MVFRKAIFLFWLSLTVSMATAEEKQQKMKTNWLPTGNLFPSLLFDYQEARTGGSIYGFNINDTWQNRAFANFSAGFRRPVVRWVYPDQKQAELGFELCVNTQFLFEQPFSFFQVNLFSVDFKVGIFYQRLMQHGWSMRARLYHVSSHLGDDFIYRFFINDFRENKRIYEVIDLTVAKKVEDFLFYGLLGYIPHTAYERKPLLLQLGGQWEKQVNHKKWLWWVAGLDIRSEQETGFYPGLHAGAGIKLGLPESMPFSILLDFYHGYLPHSLYDKARINWVGGSLLFHPF